eukprot:4201686-Amphidinium_carterae.1
MAIDVPSMRKIQKDTNETYIEEDSGTPLESWRTCRPQRATPHNIERKRISFVLFDMVAELATELAIEFAIEFASIVVSQLFYYIAWLC